MKCLFKDIMCISSNNSYDDCRGCQNVPEMSLGTELERGYLCAIAGQREKEKEYFGDPGLGNDPKWFTELLKKYEGKMGIEGCFDHIRTLEQAIISEPYDLPMEEFIKLIKFCDENGLRFTVDGKSAHYPGRCFRIVISKQTKKTA
jgi:hypothetical protein